MHFTVCWRPTRDDKPIEFATCHSWDAANNLLTCVPTDLKQYFAFIDNHMEVYHFLVTKGAGPLEVIGLENYPDMSIYDILLKR